MGDDGTPVAPVSAIRTIPRALDLFVKLTRSNQAEISSSEN